MYYSIFDDDTYMVYSDDLDYVKINLGWGYAQKIADEIRALGYDANVDYDPISGKEFWSFYN